MEKRTFGQTGLQVTLLGYGAMELRHVDENQACRLLNSALDAGVNFIDTAPDYGPSEDYIGKCIAHRRDAYYLATKCGCNVPRQGGEDTPGHIWTGEQVRHNIEHSLKRLNTDYVDVWQIHSAHPDELRGTDVLETMHQIKEEGKVRHIAVSMRGGSSRYGYDMLMDYLASDFKFEAMQIWYSALVRYPEQAIHTVASRGMGTIIRGATRRVDPWSGLEDACERIGLNDLRQPHESAAQFLLRFVISHPDVHTTIVGTQNMEHLVENVKAVTDGPLPKDTLVEAKRRLVEAGLTVGERG